MDRRTFLRSASLGALGASPNVLTAGVALAQTEPRYHNTLVLIELKGGNDGLNTVVPYEHDAYYRLRPRIAIRREEALKLDASFALHPSLAPLMALWERRELAVVHGLGYPRPNLSHFRSIEIWDTASKSDEVLQEGWLARQFKRRPVPGTYAADGVLVGSNDLGPLSGAGSRAIALANPEQFLQQARLATPAPVRGNAALAHVMQVEANVAQAAFGLRDRHVFRTEFPAGPFGNAVRAAAQVLATRSGVAVVRITQGGYDTHQNQPGVHANLLRQLAEGVVALKAALVELSRWDSTLLLTYSEFGRRAAENGSGGTDHGTAGTHFALGGGVSGGMHGRAPDLDRLDNGNLQHTTDFRSYYATAIERWWGVPADPIVGARYPLLDFLRG